MANKRPKREGIFSKLRQIGLLMMQVTRPAGSTCTGGNKVLCTGRPRGAGRRMADSALVTSAAYKRTKASSLMVHPSSKLTHSQRNTAALKGY